MSCACSPIPSLSQLLHELFQLILSILNSWLDAGIDSEQPLIMSDRSFMDTCLERAKEKYVILKTLSSGADGETFLAVRESWLERCRRPKDVRKRVRVIKVPRKEMAAENLQDEISCLEALDSDSSPRTVRLHATGGPRSNHPYAALEWVRGPTLYNFLQHWEDIPPAFVWSILAGLLEASLEIRDTGRMSFIHTDLHPRNVMLDFYDEDQDWIPSVKIIDFSRAINEHDEEYYLARYSDLRAIGTLLGMLGRSCHEPGECDENDRKFRKMHSMLTDADFECRDVHTIYTMLEYAKTRKRRALEKSSCHDWEHFSDKYRSSRLLKGRDIRDAVREWRRDRRR